MAARIVCDRLVLTESTDLFTFTFRTANAVPEPASALLVVLGAAVMARRRSTSA